MGDEVHWDLAQRESVIADVAEHELGEQPAEVLQLSSAFKSELIGCCVNGSYHIIQCVDGGNGSGAFRRLLHKCEPLMDLTTKHTPQRHHHRHASQEDRMLEANLLKLELRGNGDARFMREGVPGKPCDVSQGHAAQIGEGDMPL